jgi:hypothetical protein
LPRDYVAHTTLLRAQRRAFFCRHKTIAGFGSTRSANPRGRSP